MFYYDLFWLGIVFIKMNVDVSLFLAKIQISNNDKASIQSYAFGVEII